MKIGFCQFEINHKATTKNLETILNLLNNIQADLIVLPELALTGYYFEHKQELIEHSNIINTKAIKELTTLSKKTGTTYVIGIGEVEDPKLFNTALVINHKGVIGKHRKINLTNNETIFDAGDSVKVIDLGNYKLGIAICFETWFPEIFRILSDKGADLIVSPANFGGPWTLDVARVRALENSIPVILTNRLGSELIQGEKDDFRGESRIIDGYGNIILSAEKEPYVGIIEIDLNDFQRHRNLISDDTLKERKKYIKIK